MRGFLTFLNRGNVLDLAIAVVIGGAFGAVVTALVKDLLTPLIAAIAGKPDFGRLAFTLNRSTFAYGDFINALVSFVCIAGAVYALVVVPQQRLVAWRQRGETAEPKTIVCPECLSEVPIGARRCRFCTSPLPH